MLVNETLRSLRSLVRAPGLCAVAIATLALAIGGAGGLYSLLDAVVLRSLPVRDPSRLVAVFPANGEALFGVTMPTLAAFAAEQHAFTGVCGAAAQGAITVEVDGAHVLRPSEAVTGDCTRVLGIDAAIGRLITPDDAPVTGANAAVVVISHRFWRDSLRSGPDAIGQTLRVEGRPLTIIGVLPESYRGLNADEAPDVVLPLGTMWQLRGGRTLATHMVGRLRDEVTLDVMRQHLRETWAAAWAATNPAGLPEAARRAGLPDNLRVESLDRGFSTLRGRFTQPLIVAIALAALLVLLAAINVGALLLARAVAREQQIAVQLALGASRARLAISLLVEGAFLALTAAILAVPIAWAGSRLVASIAWTGSRPLTMTVTPSVPTYAAIALVTLVAGIVVSLGPIVLIVIQDFRVTTVRSVFAATRHWRRALVVTQVAMSFALVFCAALFSSNLAGLRGKDLGYADDGLLWSRLELVFGAPRAYDFDSYVRTLLDRASSLPSVESAALAIGFPTTEVRFTTARFPIERPAEGTTVARGIMDRVSPGFFRTTRVALLQGREFDWNDTQQSSAVAIITQPLADQLFPDGVAVGQQIRIPGRKPQDLTVVGVSGDFSPGDPRIVDVPRIYVPMMQEPATGQFPTILLRINGDVDLVTPLRTAVAGLGRHQVSSLRTIRQQTDRLLTQERLLSSIAVAFGLLGAVLGSLGLYALLTHAVVRRAREMGLRMALGATRSAIHALIVREGVVLVLIGAAVGIPLALAGGFAVRALLFDVSPFDASALAVTMVASLAIAVTAALIPAARASRTDPATALRAE
jgi:putative ABC transport system permease protein